MPINPNNQVSIGNAIEDVTGDMLDSKNDLKSYLAEAQEVVK